MNLSLWFHFYLPGRLALIACIPKGGRYLFFAAITSIISCNGQREGFSLFPLLKSSHFSQVTFQFSRIKLNLAFLSSACKSSNARSNKHISLLTENHPLLKSIFKKLSATIAASLSQIKNTFNVVPRFPIVLNALAITCSCARSQNVRTNRTPCWFSTPMVYLCLCLKLSTTSNSLGSN